MNKGIMTAKGEWLFFLGSDDELFNENILEDISHVISKNPKSKFIYGDVYTSNKYTQKYDSYTYYKLLRTNICHQAIFYHCSLFEKTKYDLKYKLSADWDFNLKVFKNKNHPYYINKTISKFNLNGTSGDWIHNQEVKDYFHNKKEMIMRYKNSSYYTKYFIMIKLQTLYNKIKTRLS